MQCGITIRNREQTKMCYQIAFKLCLILHGTISASIKMNCKYCIGCTNKVALHPTVAHYACSKSNCNNLVTYEVVHVSDDLKYGCTLNKEIYSDHCRCI